MIRLKQGVRLGGVCSEIVMALHVADGCYQRAGLDEMWVTSLNDGTHSPRSFHYSGRACDLRTHNVQPGDRSPLFAAIKDELGADYEVFYEGKDTPNEHFHIEFQPLK